MVARGDHPMPPNLLELCSRALIGTNWDTPASPLPPPPPPSTPPIPPLSHAPAPAPRHRGRGCYCNHASGGSCINLDDARRPRRPAPRAVARSRPPFRRPPCRRPPCRRPPCRCTVASHHRPRGTHLPPRRRRRRADPCCRPRQDETDAPRLGRCRCYPHHAAPFLRPAVGPEPEFAEFNAWSGTRRRRQG